MWRSKLGGQYLKDDIQKQDAEHHKVLKRLRAQPSNDHCAECGAKETTWASVNLGVFVCVQCADVHRALGTHISKVKGCGGTYLWGPDEIARMQSLGNRAWGAPQGQPSMSKEVMLRLCQAKYENQQPPMPRSTKDTTEPVHGSGLACSGPAFEQHQRIPRLPQPTAAAKCAPRMDCSQVAPEVAVRGSDSASLDDFLNECLMPTSALHTERAAVPAAYPAHLNPFVGLPALAQKAPIAHKCAQDFDFDAFFDECFKAQ